MTKELDPDYPVFEQVGEDEENEEFGNALYGLYGHDTIIDRDGREYSHVGRFLSDDDFYQGLNMVSVIKRRSDDKIFGFFWWDDISKHGESLVEANGEEFGLECNTDADDFDWDNDYVSYYVFVPVEPYPITAYKEIS